MDSLLAKAGSQIITFAVRSGVQMASSYVINSVGKLMESIPEKDKKKIERLKNKLQTRIEIVTYAIELIQIVASRGNTNLESTLRLTRDLKQEIDEFEENIENLTEDLSNSKKITNESIKSVESYMQGLLMRIEQAIPVINLALTTSGANMSDTRNISSPGRLLKSTVIINDSNIEFESTKKAAQVGPTFSLTLYDIFYNPARTMYGESEISWREKLPKCQLRLLRTVNGCSEYSYKLEILEDLNDGRYHDEDEVPEKRYIDIRVILKLFFTASGKLLKLDERTSPVLVFKTVKTFINSNIKDPDFDDSENKDIEWIAVGDYEENSEHDETEDAKGGKKISSVIKVNSESNLSLLEYLVRLCALQANDQTSLLKVKDERLRLYLDDENTYSVLNGNESVLPEKFSKMRVSPDLPSTDSDDKSYTT